jgi:hypothetical protein
MCIVSAVFIYGGSSGSSVITIQGEGGTWVFDADANETITVGGPLGDTRISLNKGIVRVLDSPCDNKTCVAAGQIHAAGQWLSCLPNRVMVTIEGSKNDLDAGVW